MTYGSRLPNKIRRMVFSAENLFSANVLEQKRFGPALLLLISLAWIVLTAFTQSRVALILPSLVLLGAAVERLCCIGTTCTLPCLAIISATCSTVGIGSFFFAAPENQAGILVWQGLLATTAFAALAAGVVMTQHRWAKLGLGAYQTYGRSAESQLRRSEQLHRLLSENASDVISRFDLAGNRLYVSPSVREVLGWTPKQMSDAGWKDRVHPDDMVAFIAAGNKMRAGDDRIDVVYRYRRPDESWTWIEARLRLVRDAQGSPAEFISNARDITQQKMAEQALARAMDELSILATTDGLTGLANRRRFDETLRKEWRRAMRSSSAVSLLMIDVDHFKPYNDLYGHRQGDDCLRVIASVMSVLARRPGDLCARYGGEEFALILPNTDAAGARELGERVLAAVATLKREHANAPAGFVTISIGAATITPTRHTTSNALIEDADAALYGAKREGRNRLMPFLAMPSNAQPNQRIKTSLETDVSSSPPYAG